MKSGVLIVLIFCGTLLLAGPAIMDHFRDSGDLMMSSGSRMAFWLAGALMILGGIVGGVLGAWRQPRLTK